MNYTAWMMAALGCGMGVTVWQARRRNLPVTQVVDIALVALAVGVLGARAGYVWRNWDYFYDHLSEAVQWWRGGLDWHPGLAAGVIAAAVYGRWQRLPTLRLLDACTPGLAIGCALGWLACYKAGCAYGLPVWPNEHLWVLAADLPGAYGIAEPRVAVQLIGAGYSLLALAAGRWWFVARAGGWLLVDRHSPFVAFICLYSAGMFALGFLRGDEMVRLASLRLDQWLDATFTATALVFYALRITNHVSHFTLHK